MAEGAIRWSELTDSIRESAENDAALEEIHETVASALVELTQAEQATYHSERQAFDRWNKERNRWLQGYNKIFQQLPNLIENIKEIVSSLDEDEHFLRANVDTQERLHNRKEGLSIILRMLERLPQRQEMMDKIVIGDAADLNKLKIDAHHYHQVLGQTLDPGSVVSKINEILEEIETKYETVRDENYHIIRKLRQKTEASKQAVAGFLRDYLIPVVDGLEQGIQDEPELIKAIENNQSEIELIDKWFGAYHQAYRLMTNFLKKIELIKLKVEIGDEFDPQWHMALGHDTSPDFIDNQILKILRNGWNYNCILIRPAEVLVVRNVEGKCDDLE